MMFRVCPKPGLVQLRLAAKGQEFIVAEFAHEAAVHMAYLLLRACLIPDAGDGWVGHFSEGGATQDVH
jgi:hypothetical protein